MNIKHIARALALAAIAAVPTLGAAQEVTIEDVLRNVGNTTPVQISTSSSMVLVGQEDNTVAAVSRSGVAADDQNALWIIYNNDELGRRYIINVAAMKFLASDGTNSVLTSTATSIAMAVRSADEMAAIDMNNGGVFGLPAKYAGTNLIIQSDSVRASDPFILSPEVSDTAIPDETLAAIAEMCSTKAVTESRRAALQAYVDEVHASVKKGMENYVGLPDVTALEAAIKGNAPLDELDALYSEALGNTYPLAGHYYRLRNIERPVKNAKANILSPLKAGGFQCITNDAPALGASGARLEDLSIFTFDVNEANPTQARLAMAAAPASYVRWNGAQTSLSDSHLFQMERRDQSPYHFRLKLTDANAWMTISGAHMLVNYGQEEEPEWFWIEEVKSIPVALNDEGLATITLPCPVELPAGAEAFIVPSCNDKYAYVEKIGSTIPAHTPFVIKGEPSATLDLTVVPGEYTLTTANVMKGSCVVESGRSARYVAALDDAGNLCFKKIATALNANDGYILASDINATADVIPVTDDITLGIEGIEADDSIRDDSDSDIFFDLQGRQIRRPKSGIYINGTTGTVRVR